MINPSVAQPVAYLRKSVSGRDKADEQTLQRALIEALAATDGQRIAHWFDGDWGRSGGRASRDKRLDMAALIDAVRLGHVSILYAYHLDRLARDTEYGLTLWNACADAGVPIVTDSGRFNTSDPADRMRYVITMEMATGEHDRITKRNRDVAASRENSGGHPAYGSDPKHPNEDVQVIVEAALAAGSFLGAAKALTLAGVPTRQGGLWSQRSVGLICRRADVEAGLNRFPMVKKRTRSARSDHAFAGLVYCACGERMIASTRSKRRKDGTFWVGGSIYYCRKGHLDPRHVRPFMMTERDLRPWAIEALSELPAQFRSLDKTVADRTRLGNRRDRVIDSYLDGSIDKVKRDRELARIDSELQRIGTSARAIHFVATHPRGYVDWNGSPADINADLRTLLVRIDASPDMKSFTPTWAFDLNAPEEVPA